MITNYSRELLVSAREPLPYFLEVSFTSPLFFQVCPAQLLWTSNGADRQGTARRATSTGDRNYLPRLSLYSQTMG